MIYTDKMVIFLILLGVSFIALISVISVQDFAYVENLNAGEKVNFFSDIIISKYLKYDQAYI